MDDTTTTPERTPARHRPRRSRRRERSEPHGARDIGDSTAEIALPAAEPSQPQTVGGGGSSGRGPVDDDGGRRPDRNGDDALRFLIAIGLIAVGAGVMGVRLAKAGRRPA